MNRILISEAINKIGEQVVLKGWVHVRRNLGKMVFFDLRDMSGLMQVIIPPSADANTIETAKAIRPEYVVAVTGTVQARKPGSENDKLSTGKVEILAEKLEIISEAKTPPFEIENEDRQAIEELRLKYRYLDLRHERMARNIKQRSNVIRYVIDYLTDRGFVYIQTPILSKSTPEGA
ncbi:MAG TPA: aspartate--tRNA ligase, partial [Candidatus Veblenbacteria bacterium]|nr:aspartate--tRNA ligase [Candidatus Veblenbacteria bacterium]